MPKLVVAIDLNLLPRAPIGEDPLAATVASIRTAADIVERLSLPSSYRPHLPTVLPLLHQGQHFGDIILSRDISVEYVGATDVETERWN